MLASDIIGALASLAAAIPAIKDQVLRFRRAAEKRRESKSPVPGFRALAASAWEYKRHAYDAADSLLLAIGCVGLFLAFGLKALGA